ncbi:MAG: ribD, partial [Actinomycetia bacterium]|nr:ribD [Actinomycetes bacterium]
MDDIEAMDRALALAASVRVSTPPNPWVGCVLEAPDGRVFEGATAPPGGAHAEAAALALAG